MSKLDRTTTPLRTNNLQSLQTTEKSVQLQSEVGQLQPVTTQVDPEDFQQSHSFEKTSQLSQTENTNQLPQASQHRPQASRVSPLLRLQINASSEQPESLMFRDNPEATTEGAAERLHEAFKGVGTNEKEVFRVLRDRTSEEIELIRADYSELYGTSLDEELTSELNGNDLRKAELLMAGDSISPTERSAEWLHMAMKGWGTDEKAILDTLYGTNNIERNDIKIAYHKLTGSTLGGDIRSEHSGSEKIMALAMLERGTISDADILRAAMRGIGTDKDAIFRTLEGKTPEQLEEMQYQYREYYERDLPRDLKKELRGSDEAKALALLKHGTLTPADKLHIAMEGWGTNFKAICEVFEGTTAEERTQIILEYSQEYGSLNDDLKSELNKTQWAEIQSLMEHGELSLAETLNRHMRGLGTDEEGILTALNGQSLNDITEAKSEYRSRYKRSLEAHIQSELSGRDLEKAKILLKQGSYDTLQDLHYLTVERKVDTAALFEALEQVPEHERGTLNQDFHDKYGSTLSTRLRSKLKGSNEVKALYLLESGPLSLEQKLDVAMVGVGTRENEVFDAVAQATPEERKALSENDELMGKLDKALMTHDRERLGILLENGELTRTEKLHFAMAGRGTDEELLFEALADLSPEERAFVQKDYKTQYGTELMDDLKSELGKRDLWKAQDALALPPATLREHVERVEDKMLRERDSGSYASNFSDSLMDTFYSTGRQIDQEFRELRHVYKQAKTGELSPTEANQQVVEKEVKLDKLAEHYRGQKDSTAKTVSGIATMSVAAAATVATAGMATLPAAAIVAAGAGTTKVMTKHVVIGESYDVTGLEAAQDFVIGAGEGLATVAMGKAGEALYSSLGKQILAAQGQDVSRQGLMALGRKALQESGQTVTQELLEKASEETLKKTGKEFFKQSILHKVVGSSLSGAAKGAAFTATKTAANTIASSETWESEMSEAIMKVLGDTGASAVKGAKSWAVTLAALQLGSQVSGAAMETVKHSIGERLVDTQDITFSASELREAGLKALGEQAQGVDAKFIEAIGREKLVLDIGSKFFEENLAGQALDIIAGQLLKRGTAAYTRNVIESLNNHEVWRDGAGEAIENLWRSSNETALKGTAQWGGKDVAMELAKRSGVVHNDASSALLSSVLWRSLGATINK